MDTSQTGIPEPKKKLAVIGLGYVGLPLAVSFALTEKYQVIGFDISRERLAELAKGHDRTLQCNKQDLEQIAGSLLYTNSSEHLGSCDIYIVTVPTPVDEHCVPDLSALNNACLLIGQAMTKGALIIFESTVYPGCTEEFCVPMLERFSGRKLNEDFFVGYSPERVNPGDKNHRLDNTTKVVSGSNQETLVRVRDLYLEVCKSVYRAPSIKVAEAAKVIENAQRDINIAFVNELAMLFSRMGIDTQEVLAAARTKWNFLDFRPGLVGGHCIGVDPYYLTHAAKAHGYHTQMILAGREVNESVAPFLALRLFKKMVRRKNSSEDFRVLVLGETFKEDCPDTRNSKVTDLVRELESLGCDVVTWDPMLCLSGLPEGVDYDGIVVAVAHREFRDKSFPWSKLKTAHTVLLDVKGIVPDEFVDLRL